MQHKVAGSALFRLQPSGQATCPHQYCEPPRSAVLLAAKKKSKGSNRSSTAIQTRPPSSQLLNDMVNGNHGPAVGGDGGQEMDKITHKRYYGVEQRAHRCLVLDSAYRPVNIVPWSRAVMMDVAEKGEVVVYYEDAFAVSGRGVHQLPAAFRVSKYINMDDICSRVSCTRRNVFVRDKFQCQYCNATKDLTVDHLKPVCLGGKSTWTNLVTACQSCNQEKGMKMLHNLPGWRLKREPTEPTSYDLGIIAGLDPTDIASPPDEWVMFLEPYLNKAKKLKAMANLAGVSKRDSPTFIIDGGKIDECQHKELESHEEDKQCSTSDTIAGVNVEFVRVWVLAHSVLVQFRLAGLLIAIM
eukprot:gene28414-31555_t